MLVRQLLQRSLTHRLEDSETLRPTDRAECPESGVMFPVPDDLVGLTVAQARARWCGDVLDESPPAFYRVDDPSLLQPL